jgi:hypothetical protein
MRYLLPALFAISAVSAQVADPVFSGIPFDKWTETSQARFRWHPEVAAMGLTDHQRLMFRIQVKVDGAELVKRRGKGDLLMLVELKDSQGHVFQTHGSLSLSDVTEDTGRSDLEFAQDAFLTPGDYQASLAVYAPGTGEYVLSRRKLHVDPLPRDPLPDAWRDLPTVEFLRSPDPPDSWFQPAVRGRLYLPVTSHRRVQVDLLVNTTPSEEPPNSRAARNSPKTIAAVIPAMKTLAQLKLENGSVSFAMFDLARQKVTYESGTGLYWDIVKNALTDTNSHKIDIGSLAKREGNAQFFVKEVARRVEDSRASDAMHFLIVLSAPMAFVQGEDLRPIQISAGKNCKVFYIRYSPMSRRAAFGQPDLMAGQRGAANFPRGLPPAPADSLEHTLKGLNPRLFEVTSPLEFRKSLATIIEEMERASR